MLQRLGKSGRPAFAHTILDASFPWQIFAIAFYPIEFVAND
jgi:hypothetical protein